MDDLISRQAAIDIFDDYNVSVENGYLEAYSRDRKRLCELPSARPEIIHCKDCKNSEHWYRDRRRCFLWSEDGISVFDDGFCNYAERRHDG